MTLKTAFLALLCLLLAIGTISLNVMDEQCPLACENPPPRKEGARIFYLILVHNQRTLNDALHLFRAIRDPRNTIVVHVDSKARSLIEDDESDLQKEMRSCSCGSKTHIEAVHSVEWSKWSMNLPTLWGLEYAITHHVDDFDLFINLSGDSMPVFTPDATSEMMRDFQYNIITSSATTTGLAPTSIYHFPSFWHKRMHYTDNEMSEDPVIEYRDENGTPMSTKVITHFGSQWIILRNDFCRWFVKELSRTESFVSRYRDHVISAGRLMTDETFIPTVLVHSDSFNLTIPSMDFLELNGPEYPNHERHLARHLRFERMDEHVPTAFGEVWENQRYQVPTSSGVEETRPWGPYFLGAYDFAALKESGALFARKVSKEIEPNMLRLLPVEHASQIPLIDWPKEVNITEKVDWSKWKGFLKALEKRAEAARQVYDDDDEEL